MDSLDRQEDWMGDEDDDASSGGQVSKNLPQWQVAQQLPHRLEAGLQSRRNNEAEALPFSPPGGSLNR